MDSAEAMPQHALELPLILSPLISRGPPPLLGLPHVPAALIEASVCQCEPALALHGVSFPFALIPVPVREDMFTPA